MGEGGPTVVAVFGSNAAGMGQGDFDRARDVGRVLAELGYTVANGGYGGTMESSARGAAEAGGKTIGVTCSCWSSSPNAYIREVIETSSLPERLGKLVEVASAGYVVLPGATGTLVELAWVWENMLKGLLPRRPLVCVGPFWRPVIDVVTAARPRSADSIAVIDSPQQLPEHFPRRT